MLVLSRRVGEEIIIDGGIRITVTAIDRHKVRIGVTAPSHVLVDRAEVHIRRLEESEDSSNPHTQRGSRRHRLFGMASS
jgi:carbon storage regulator